MAIDGGSVEIRFEGNTEPLRRALNDAGEYVDQFGEKWKLVEREVANGSTFEHWEKDTKDNFQKFADTATDAFLKATDASEDFIKSLSGIGTSLKSIGFGALTGAATAAGGALISLAKKGIQATDFLETSRVAMSGLTGSIEEGNKAMSLAANYWQNNPFQRIDVTQATKQLVQFGRTTKDIAGDLDILGNVSLSTGMNIADLARYYARVSSSGRAMTMDLEMMSDRGVPIYRELEKILHTTTAGVREMASKGKIDFETFRKAMEGAVSAEAMEQYENTMARQVDRLKGSVQIIAGQLAGYKIVNDQLVISEQGLEKAWTRLLKTLATNLRSDSMKNAMEKIGNALAKLVDKITTLVEPALNLLSKALDFVGDNSELLLPILGGVLVMFGRLGSQLPVIGGLVGTLSKNITGLGKGMKSLIIAHPIISGLVALFTVGFADAMKNSAEFRDTISSLLSSLRQIFSNLMTTFRGVIQVIAQFVKMLADSGIVQGILQGIATALSWIAKAVASIPPEALAGILSFFASIKLLNASPITFVATAILLLIQYIKELGGISKFFEQLPKKLATIGHNIMTGLFNGIKEGASKVVQFVKNIAKAIIDTFKNMFGIHSPSTVMYGMGQNIGLGLANGIEDSSDAVQVAMANLAEDILKLSEKIIANKVDFGILDVKEEYKEWKKVSQLFTQGSEQYNYAVQKMEDVRKEANLKILALQKEYNKELDTTIDKIANMYGIFDEVNLGGSKNSQTILKNLDQQVAKMQEWADAQKQIAGLGLDDKLVEELKAMGVASTGELSAIANMTSDELSTLNNMWLQKQSIANEEGVRQMEGLKNDTLDQINELKKGIDGTTVDVEDVGGRLVEHISEGVYGAMPTLESAFSKLNDYIVKAQKELAKTASGGSGVGGDVGAGAEINVPDAAETLKEELTGSIDKLKSMLPNILLGALAAVGAVKLGPKILKAIGSKLFGGGIFRQGLSGLLMGGNLNKAGLTNFVDMLFAESEEGSNSQKIISKIQDKLKGIGSDGTLKKTAEQISKTSKPAKTIAESTQSIGSSMETTSKSMSKAQSWMKSIQEGAKTIIYIAGAIAAVAGALWVTYNALKDVDWGQLALQLVAMGLAVAEFGLLAKAADMLKISGKSILILIGIAVDIAAVAVACRAAYEIMKDVPWDGFASALGMMAIAIGAFGLLNGIMGIGPVAIAEGLGLLVSAGIILEIVSLSTSIKYAYSIMKDISWEGFGQMIGEMAAALGSMGALNAPLALVMPLVAIGWLSVTMICDELGKVAQAIYTVYQKTPDDLEGTTKKIDAIRSVLNKMADSDLGTLIGSMVAGWTIGNLVPIVDNYAHTAEQLNKIQEISLDENAIVANLNKIQSALEQVKSKSDFFTATLQSWADSANASSVESAGKVITIYGSIVDTLEKLSDVKISDNAQNGVVTLTNFVQKVLDTIATVTTQWGVNYGAIEQNIGLAQSVLNKFSEMIPVIQKQIQTESVDVTAASKTIESIKQIVTKIGTVSSINDAQNKEQSVGLAQSILNKFTGILPTVKQLINEGISDAQKEKAINTIATTRHLVYEIGQINQDEKGSWADKEWIVGMAASIAWKLGEFATNVKNIGNLDENNITGVIGVMNSMFESISTKFSENLSAFETLGMNIGLMLQQGLASTSDGMAVAGLALQAVLWAAIESKMNDEFQQGAWMGKQFAAGVLSVANEIGQIGQVMQTNLWWSIQNRMQDMYYQGQTMGYRFRQGLYDVDYANAGWWAAQGFINGANNRDVYSAGWQIANRFLQGLRDRGQQGSPWKTTIESGVFAVEGLIEGLKESEGALVGEATSLADQVISALTMDDLSLSPELTPTLGGVAPSVVDGEYDTMVSGRGVVINQNVTAYTEYDVEQVQRDLAWELAKV